MEHIVESQWMGKMQFNALVNGHTIVMDAPERAGGEDNGPIPKPLVLTALSGCTGMDVVAILRKSGITLRDFLLTVKGEIAKQHPIEYIAAHVEYRMEGAEENKEAALHAVMCSQEQLCAVSSMMKKAMPVTWSVFYNDYQIFNNKREEVTQISQKQI